MNNVQILTDDLMRSSGNNIALFMHKNYPFINRSHCTADVS